ncbi:MAG: hypothetical protein QXX51_06420 [Candidatus Bathyarchaeia archaeon]
MDLPILFASLILFAMGCLALVLSIVFRLKFRELDSLPKNLSAKIFDKTFVVFNPYASHGKIIHSYLLTSVFIASFTAFLVSLFLFFMIAAGLVLSIFFILTALNLIVLDDAFDVYGNSKLFLNAIHNGDSLGVGDLKVFSHLKLFTRKLSNYYLGVTIFLLLLSMLLPYVFYPALFTFCQFMGLIIQASSIAGAVSWQFAVFLFALVLVFFEMFVIKIKVKLFKV